MEKCFAEGPAPAIGPDVYRFNLDLEVDIGWRMFTVTHLDPGADVAGCFGGLKRGETYPLGDCEVCASARWGYIRYLKHGNLLSSADLILRWGGDGIQTRLSSRCDECF